jgi:hypothetical protein
MKRKPWPVLVLCLVLLSAAPTLADGDIYAGGPWGTKITSLPYIIKTPGAYYLGGNLSYAGSGNGITIDAGVNHVTLDLMGFTLDGSGNPNWGIFLNGSKNVEIRNGTVTGWGYGIMEEGYSARLHRIINVRVVGNQSGIFLRGQGHLIKGCKVTATGSNTAIYIGVSAVSGCMVKFIDGNGIQTAGGIVSHNVVLSTGTASPRYGIYVYDRGTLIKGNRVSGCAYGIYDGVGNGLNVIGNTVDAASGTTGIYLNDDYSTLFDQNSGTGAGIHYNGAYSKVYQRGSNY